MVLLDRPVCLDRLSDDSLARQEVPLVQAEGSHEEWLPMPLEWLLGCVMKGWGIFDVVPLRHDRCYPNFHNIQKPKIVVTCRFVLFMFVDCNRFLHKKWRAGIQKWQDSTIPLLFQPPWVKG
eukprot:gene18469-biopygen5436